MAEHKVRLGGERWAIPETLIRNDTNYFFGIFFPYTDIDTFRIFNQIKHPKLQYVYVIT